MKIPYLLPMRCLLLAISVFFASKWWTSVAIVCNLVTIAVLFFYSRKDYKSLLNYKKGKTNAPKAIITVIITLAVGMGGLYLAGLICYGEFPYLDETLVEPIPLWLAIIVLLFLPATTTLAEDGLYLGYGINAAESDNIVYAFAAAFFYALQHSFIPFLPDGIFMLYRFLSFLPLTTLICLLYRKSKNPLPFMISHFILNVATAVQILIMTVLF